MSTTTRPLPKKEMSEEEIQNQIARAYAQKRFSIIEGLLFNLAQNPNITSMLFNDCNIVDIAIKLGDEYMQKAFAPKAEE